MIERKLRHLCRRGTKELDVLTLNYLEHHYPHAQAEEQRLFHRLLNMDDPDLYAWIHHPSVPKTNSKDQLAIAIKEALKTR